MSRRGLQIEKKLLHVVYCLGNYPIAYFFTIETKNEKDDTKNKCYIK